MMMIWHSVVPCTGPCVCVEHMFLLPPSLPACLCLSPSTLATPNYSIPKPICHSLPLTPELAPETDFEWTFSGSSWALWFWQHFFPSFGLKLNLVSVSFSVWACLAFRLCLCLLWIAIPISMPDAVADVDADSDSDFFRAWLSLCIYLLPVTVMCVKHSCSCALRETNWKNNFKLSTVFRHLFILYFIWYGFLATMVF